MGTLFLPDDADGIDCPNCGAVVTDERAPEKHDTARHGMQITDADGRYKMYGGLVDEVGRHLRDECAP